ncbi:hypothetical protein M422DRAFT_263141 [Sphaerobolus stellatus SS14]|uniref:Uncharacterized protein n=1 Tax=Sphaerobolus stellatus (strain SS14) TaxID=990650 RepID=A0A0C9TWK0_SPHS4|nr:hypothetical protein M422DRAFT_263141 [Sphaerobolus stellatus SS14]
MKYDMQAVIRSSPAEQLPKCPLGVHHSLHQPKYTSIGGIAIETAVPVAILGQLPSLLSTVQADQDKVTSASRALGQLESVYVLVNATDSKAQQEEIRLQIQSLTSDLNDLQARWQVLTSQAGGTPKKIDTSGQALDPSTPLPLPQESSFGGSRWQTITLQSTKTSRTNASQSDSKESSEACSVNLWFASSSGGSTSGSASSNTSTTESNDTIDLVFRATLVTVDRGGWFQPQFSKESKTYYKINPNISWVDRDGGVMGLMPSFPVVFIIAKDIVIRVVH